MELYDAIQRLSALAQAPRLEVFRLLVKAGPGGLAAGEIARSLDVAANTMSGAATPFFPFRTDAVTTRRPVDSNPVDFRP